MLSVRFLDSSQRTLDQTVLGWLLDLLPGARRLTVASAYFDGRILDWLEEPLEALIARGGAARFVIGSNSGITRRADLERLWRVLEPDHPQSSLCVEYYDDAIFHPKVFVVEADDAVRAFVGSPNFTANGSLLNIETGLEVATDAPGPPPEAPLDEILASIENRATAVSVTSTGDLDRLEQLGVIGRQRVATPAPDATRAASQQQRRRQAGMGLAGAVTGIPAPTRRSAQPRPRPPRRTAAPIQPPLIPVVPSPRTIVALQFSRNDLKSTGTREISVSHGIRAWAETVLGRAIAPGEGNLLDVTIDARLSLTPTRIFQTPQPARLWAAGGSGGTHTDVRQVLGTVLKSDLDSEALRLTGRELEAGAVGVFELPADPAFLPVRLTIFVPQDPAYASLVARLGRVGRSQKLEFVGAVPELPPWPF